MPRNEPQKDVLAHSEAATRGELKPRDPVAESARITERSREHWEKLTASGELQVQQKAEPVQAKAEPEALAVPPSGSDQKSEENEPGKGWLDWMKSFIRS